MQEMHQMERARRNDEHKISEKSACLEEKESEKKVKRNGGESALEQSYTVVKLKEKHN